MHRLLICMREAATTMIVRVEIVIDSRLFTISRASPYRDRTCRPRTHETIASGVLARKDVFAPGLDGGGDEVKV